MKLYVVATVFALVLTGLIVNAHIFRDSATQAAPVNVAHLR